MYGKTDTGQGDVEEGSVGMDQPTQQTEKEDRVEIHEGKG